MNKKRIAWLTGGLLAGVLLGWLAWRLLWPGNVSADVLVPPDALLVLESTALQQPEAANPVGLPLRRVPVFGQAVRGVERLLYSALDSGAVRRFMTDRPVRYSLHSVSKSALAFVFYLPITPSDDAFVSQLQQPDPSRFRVQSRPFGGSRIDQLTNLASESFGFFTLIDGWLVGSSSGLLLENVVRQHRAFVRTTKPALPLPVDDLDGDVRLASVAVAGPVLEQLFGRVAVGGTAAEQAGSLVRLFLPRQLSIVFRPSGGRSHLIGSAASDIGDRQDVAALFSGQTPTRIQGSALIPQTTATLYHLGFSDATRFGRRLSALLGSASDDALRQRVETLKPVSAGLYAALRQEILLCRLDATGGAGRQILLLRGENSRSLSEAYQRVAYALGARSTAPLRTFLGHKVLLLNVPELPASLFTSLMAGFAESWITQHDNYLVVANSEAAMQDYLQQLQRGAVWADDERQAALLTETLRPANFSAFVRLNRAGTAIPTDWPTGWQALLNPNRVGLAGATSRDGLLGNLENMVYQASYGRQKLQSTLVLGRTTRPASLAVLNRLLLQKRIEFNAPLIAAPIAAGALADETVQIYAQNNAGQFVLLTQDGDKIVQDTTDGPIRSNVLTVDFLNNGRPQYLFMTDRTLYVADPRLNPDEPGVRLQSIRLPEGLESSFLARPVGVRQRNLLALAAHRDGHIYALDASRRAWIRLMTASRPGPLLLPFQVSDGPGGMEVLALQADGTLNRWLESGKAAPHFPARLVSDTLDVTYAGPAVRTVTGIHVVTDMGRLLRLNNNGLIAEAHELFRPVRSGPFRLLPDLNQTDYLVLGTTDTEASVLSQTGQFRFDVRTLKAGQTLLRYHRLGAGVAILSVKSGDYTTLFDLNANGRLIGDRPIPGRFPVTIQFDENTNQLYILTAVDKSVQLYTIRLR